MRQQRQEPKGAGLSAAYPRASALWFHPGLPCGCNVSTDTQALDTVPPPFPNLHWFRNLQKGMEERREGKGKPGRARQLRINKAESKTVFTEV